MTCICHAYLAIRNISEIHFWNTFLDSNRHITVKCYRVAMTHRMPYLYGSFSAKETYNWWLFCENSYNHNHIWYLWHAYIMHIWLSGIFLKYNFWFLQYIYIYTYFFIYKKIYTQEKCIFEKFFWQPGIHCFLTAVCVIHVERRYGCQKDS